MPAFATAALLAVERKEVQLLIVMPSLIQIAFELSALVALFLMAWASIRFFVAPRLGVWCLYMQAWTVAIFIVWVGVVLALVGWVIPILKSDSSLDVNQKILRAALAAVLLYIGKQLLELRHLHVAAEVMKWIFEQSFSARVPRALPMEKDDHPLRLAYRAVHDENVVVPGVTTIKGRGVFACCRRIGLVRTVLP